MQPAMNIRSCVMLQALSYVSSLGNYFGKTISHNISNAAQLYEASCDAESCTDNFTKVGHGICDKCTCAIVRPVYSEGLFCLQELSIDTIASFKVDCTASFPEFAIDLSNNVTTALASRINWQKFALMECHC